MVSYSVIVEDRRNYILVSFILRDDVALVAEKKYIQNLSTQFSRFSTKRKVIPRFGETYNDEIMQMRRS